MLGRVHIGDRVLLTRFAIPSGRAAEVLAALDRDALGLARARIAAELGDPDPFHVRAALAADPEAAVAGTGGEALDADAAEAVLVAAGDAPGLAGLFAFHPPGPRVRGVPLDGPRAGLRWRRPALRPPRLGAVESWTAKDVGDEDVATLRCFCPIPGGLAIGSDYGLTLWRRGRFEPFPWPRGARREARRVEAMAFARGVLHVATTQALVTWDLRGEPKVRKHGPDQEEGYDDLNALLAVGDRLYLGWRTRFEGGDGPPDVLALAADPAGVVYAGTRAGELHVIDGSAPGAPLRRFADHRPRPVRHLAWADGALWVAAQDHLWRFDGVGWSSLPGEPGALGVDQDGRLWALADGGLALIWDGAPRPVPLELVRPWALGFTPGSLWVGGVGRLWRIDLR